MTNDTVPKTAKLTLGDQEIELPVMVGSEGELAIDIRKLRSETGAITYDPGLGNTGACTSNITFLDGEKGILRYAGFPIEDLAEQSTFVEVMWLLLHQQLPTAQQLASFTHDVTYHTMMHEDLKRLFGSLPKAGHPMAVCAAAVGACSPTTSPLCTKSEPRSPKCSLQLSVRNMCTSRHARCVCEKCTHAMSASTHARPRNATSGATTPCGTARQACRREASDAASAADSTVEARSSESSSVPGRSQPYTPWPWKSVHASHACKGSAATPSSTESVRSTTGCALPQS